MPPPGVVLPPFGTPVPPVGGFVVVDCVDSEVVVERVCVEVVGTVTVVLVEFELSAATMIRPMPRPITSAIRTPTIQRVRVSTA